MSNVIKTWKQRIITALENGEKFNREDCALSFRYESCALGERVLLTPTLWRNSGKLKSISLYFVEPNSAELLGRKFHEAVFTNKVIDAGKLYTAIWKLEMRKP